MKTAVVTGASGGIGGACAEKLAREGYTGLVHGCRGLRQAESLAARLCAEKGTPCFVSLEKKMACGIGACLGCTCETRGGEGKSVCKNGPVFDATEVFF